MNRDARVAECRRNRCRYVFILGRQDAWPGLEELNLRAKGVENRSNLHSSGSAANDKH